MHDIVITMYRYDQYDLRPVESDSPDFCTHVPRPIPTRPRAVRVHKLAEGLQLLKQTGRNRS